MGARDTVLVLTCDEDPTADAVIAALRRRHRARVVRFDTGDFPIELRLSATTATDGTWSGALTGRDCGVDLHRMRSVYYRRPTRFRLPDGMSPADEAYAAVEARHGLGGLLASLDVLWVNDPVKGAVAEYKPLQLALAGRCGLSVPRTLLSNVRSDVATFAKQIGGPVVCKPLSSLIFAEDPQVPMKTYTTVIEPGDIDSEAFGATAHLIQEFVPKAFDVRVTVVGESPIGVAIRSSSEAGYVDWRADYDSLSYELIDVPEPIVAALNSFLRALGLHYGAFDFVVRPDGQWTMLECNPAGQWLWLEHETGAPIAAALADLLVEGPM